MRICDKCGKKHAYCKVRHWDICEECLTLLTKWMKDKEEPAVKPTYPPKPIQMEYHIEETLNPDKTVKSRKLMLDDQVIDPNFGMSSE